MVLNHTRTHIQTHPGLTSINLYKVTAQKPLYHDYTRRSVFQLMVEKFKSSLCKIKTKKCPNDNQQQNKIEAPIEIRGRCSAFVLSDFTGQKLGSAS